MAAGTRYTKTYSCTRCEKEVEHRDKLTVKKVSFHGMGARARTYKSRVIAWLCPECLKNDPDWQRDAYTDPAESDASVAAGPTPGQLAIPTT